MQKYCRWCENQIITDSDICLTDDEYKYECCSEECAMFQEEENAQQDLGQLED